MMFGLAFETQTATQTQPFSSLYLLITSPFPAWGKIHCREAKLIFSFRHERWDTDDKPTRGVHQEKSGNFAE